jgi:hypothetical protein
MHISTFPLLLTMVSGLASAAQLTEVETRWLTAGAPVLAYAKQELKLPIDIIVQPQAGPNDVPMAMGFDNGRCKLVLSMRGNPNAENILLSIPADQRSLMIEAMTAHEVGHCWRYAQGAWHALPTGFVEVGNEQADDPALLQKSQELRETRREEGYSDLVALAWTERRHPTRYAQVYDWLKQVRHDQPLAGSSHDTMAWLQLAQDGAVFGADGTPFEQVRGLWSQGLLGDD